MGHPLIDEFCRIQSLDGMRVEFFRRCQRVFHDEVQEQLNERDRLLEENAALTMQLEKLSAKRAKVETAA